MVHKYTIDKTNIHDLLAGKEIPLALCFGKARAFKVEIVDKMTNGDMMKAIFPDVKWWLSSKNEEVFTNHIVIDSVWWNAPYKAESEDK